MLLKVGEEARACLTEDLPVCYDIKIALFSLGRRSLLLR